MSAPRAWLRRFAEMFGKARRDRDLAEELEAHVQMRTDEAVARGVPPEQARREALQRLGGLDQTKERVRDRRGIPFVEVAAQDVRYGLRMLRRKPVFAGVAIATLALGIGANTALFSVVDGVLLNPLPYPDADRLVTLHESKPNFAAGSLSYPNFRDWQAMNRTFSAMAVMRRTSFSLIGRGEPERVRGHFITADLFSILGVRPVLGRFFAKGEDEIGGKPLALIGAELWKRKFSGALDVVGSRIVLDGKDYTIVGVVPAGFDLTLRGANRSEVFLPIGQWGNSLLNERGAGLGIFGVGRMRPGVSLAQARADMSRVARNLADAYPEQNKGIGATLIPLKEQIVGEVRPYLLALLAAVAFVLLIACVNVANLLLARSTSRAREFGIRSALGAGRGRILRQLVTESLVLSILGGGLGLLLAARGTRAAVALLGPSIPRTSAIGIDVRVLLFTTAVSLLAGLVFGLAPSLRSSRDDGSGALKEGGRGAVGARNRAQAVFVVAELAMALILLIGAGLMIRTLSRLWSLDPGFEPKGVLTFNLSMPPSMAGASAAEVRAAVRDLDATLASAPGVRAASLSWETFPLLSDEEELFWLEGQPKPSNVNAMNWSLKYIVEPGYREAMRLRVQRGRFLAPGDDEHAPLVTVIDDVFARKFFGSVDPVGKRLNLDDFDQPAQIVGVVGHVRQWGLDADDTQPLRAQLYLACLQMPDRYVAGSAGGTIAVRTAGAPSALAEPLRRLLQAAHRDQVVYGMQTMEAIISDSLAARRTSMILLGAFAALALVLSAIGIYGVIAFVAGQRKGEIGIRMALGAQRRDILRLVVGQGGRLATFGIGLGILGALGLTRLMSGLLYGVSSFDPATFGAMAAVLWTVAMLASYFPARAAAAVDPMAVLRAE
ncbi:MAG TPA: ABC transporter permease [Thermoanaerobaculia bacterium]|nr:ABC transporter permease [Thermoanaerobaculia bacterium]